MVKERLIKKIYAIAMAAVLLMSMGCASGKKKVATASLRQPDKEQVWQLTAMRGRELKEGSAVVTIVFNQAAGTLSGQAACNRYFANYRLQDGTIKVSDVGRHKVTCPEAEMNAEERYLHLLARATRLTLEGNTLTLYQKDKEILKYGLQ